MNIKIIDNFFTGEDFSKIKSINLEKVDSNKIRVYHNSIDKNYKITNDCISSELILHIHKCYHEKAFGLLNELNPLKAKLYDYTDFVLIETGAHYKFPIHDDTPNKLLSGVIYIKPEKNSGTNFYKSKSGREKKIIEWKTNRGVFFSRKERSTWHSYEGDGISNRVVLVYNLMTNRIKEVYKIEHKSYFFGQFRHKINPHLYRFFKTII